MVRPVPDIYRQIAAGASPNEISDPAFKKLFRDTPDAVNVSYSGGQLTIDNGHHRIAAAQRSGVPVLPMVVKTEHPQDLRDLQQSLRSQFGAPYDSYTRVHAQLEAQNARLRDTATRSPGRDLPGR